MYPFCPRGGGHSDIFSGHFFGFKILNFNIFGGFQKNYFFWGGGGGGLNWTRFRGHFHVFRVFFKVNIFGVQNFEFQYFWGVFRKINIFGGMKILWILFWGHHKI